MNNKQYCTADRNHYFYGKLMTVRDFESEQKYINDKRRLGNRLLHGVGVVSGLNVLPIDNQTFSLEPGLAIDYLGREVLVTEPCVRRLSVLEGFEETYSGEVYLCLRYKEELRENTFSVAASATDSNVGENFNTVHEGYELFVTNEQPQPYELGLRRLMFQTIELYEGKGLHLWLETVRLTGAAQSFQATVYFTKQNVAAPVHFKFALEGNLFQGADGAAETWVTYDETEVRTYQQHQMRHIIECTALTDAIGELTVRQDSFLIRCGAEDIRLTQDKSADITITSRDLRDEIIDQYYNRSFEDTIGLRPGQDIYLARFHVVTNQTTYFIEKIDRNPFRQHLLGNDLLALLQEVSGPSAAARTQAGTVNSANAPGRAGAQAAAANIVTGVERISLGFAARAGKTYYSCEFVHGLGYGHVGVTMALENREGVLGDEDGVLCFGLGSSIFDMEEFPHSLPKAELGALLDPKKGTVQLGVRLLEKTDAQAIHVRWWAYKPAEEIKDDSSLLRSEETLEIRPNTISIEPLGQARFAPLFGGKPHEVVWSIVEKKGGTIDRNGLYTAPSIEGVYEVVAQSTRFEGKKCSAYVVVQAPDRAAEEPAE